MLATMRCGNQLWGKVLARKGNNRGSWQSTAKALPLPFRATALPQGCLDGKAVLKYNLGQRSIIRPPKEITMKRYLLAATAALGILGLVPSASWAVTCAAGVYRAGCAGPNGAAVVRKPAPAPAHVTCAKGVYREGCVGPNGGAAVHRRY